MDGAYIFCLRKASAPLSAKACLQLYPAVRHAGLLCAAQFYTRNASLMNFCAFAAFSYLFLFSALLPSAGRLFVFYSVLYALFCAFYLKYLPAKRYAAAYGAARPLYTGAPQALFRPKQPWLQRRKKRIAGRPKQSEGRTAGAQPRRAGCSANAALFIRAPVFFCVPAKGY